MPQCRLSVDTRDALSKMYVISGKRKPRPQMLISGIYLPNKQTLRPRKCELNSYLACSRMTWATLVPEVTAHSRMAFCGAI